MIGRARCLNAPDTRRDFASECRIATSHASAAALWGHSALPARGEVKSSARGGFQRCPLVKQRCLTNRHYESFADFRRAIDTYLHNLTTTAADDLHSLLPSIFSSSQNESL